MQKLYILFQTTELSKEGNVILISKENNMGDSECDALFNKSSHNISWNGLHIEDDMIRFVKEGGQKETGRGSKNILLIINKNIKNLKTKQINKIIEKVNYFFSKTFIDLKNIANKEEYYSICSSELGKLEEELLTEIPELKNDFIEKAKELLSSPSNNISDDSHKKIKYLITVLIISVIANIILLIPRNKQPIQVETKKEIADSNTVNINSTDNKNKKFDKPVNGSSIVSEEKNKIIANSSNESKSINGNNIELNTPEKTSSEVSGVNKQTESNENDIASLRYPKIKPDSSKAEKKPIEKFEQKQEIKEEEKPINKFEFIDEIANNYEISKDDLIKLVNEKTQWKDFNNLDDIAINQLKDFFNKPDNILFIKLENDKKEYLKKFFNFGSDKLNKEYVSKCKKALSCFVKAYYELCKNKYIKEKYSELYKSYYPKDRLDFVYHIFDIKSELKHNSDESKSYTYIFTENDYENAKCFEKLFWGKESIAEKYLKPSIKSELDLKTNIINCNNIADFLIIYNSKFKNLINKKLSLGNLEKKLVDNYDNWDKERKDDYYKYLEKKLVEDFTNWSPEMKNDYYVFQEKPENSDLSVNDIKKKFIHQLILEKQYILNLSEMDYKKKYVHQLISDKVNSDEFEKKLQNLNELYERFLTTIENMEEIK